MDRCTVSNTPAAVNLRGHRIQYPFVFVGAGPIAHMSSFPRYNLLSLYLGLDFVVFMLVRSCWIRSFRIPTFFRYRIFSPTSLYQGKINIILLQLKKKEGERSIQMIVLAVSFCIYCYWAPHFFQFSCKFHYYCIFSMQIAIKYR